MTAAAAGPAGGRGPGGAAAARRLRTAAGRRLAGRFLAEGAGCLSAAARTGALVEVFVTSAARQALPGEVLAAGVPVTEVSARTMAGLTGTVAPAGMVGVARSLTRPLAAVLASWPASGARDAPGGLPGLTVVLAGVADPGNAGTIVRSADASGAALVVAVGGSVELHNAKVVRASAGSVFHVPLATAATLAEVVHALRDRGIRVLAADAHAAVDLAAAAAWLAPPVAWVFGNEARGLDGAQVSLVDAAVRIPLRGSAESLNVATAAALCLYASAGILVPAQAAPGQGAAAAADGRPVLAGRRP